jgi:hypothetical protein
MLFTTLIMEGPEGMFRDLLGIPVAHLYDFLSNYWPQYGGGVNFLKAPQWLNDMLGGSRQITSSARGTALRPPPAQTRTLASSWGARGSGRRLGSD